MKTATLVQMLTSLTQVMADKVNAGDNSEVPMCIFDGLNEPFPITGLHIVTDDDGKVTRILVKTDFL